jgi:hypothetical protein
LLETKPVRLANPTCRDATQAEFGESYLRDDYTGALPAEQVDNDAKGAGFDVSDRVEFVAASIYTLLLEKGTGSLRQSRFESVRKVPEGRKRGAHGASCRTAIRPNALCV